MYRSTVAAEAVASEEAVTDTTVGEKRKSSDGAVSPSENSLKVNVGKSDESESPQKKTKIANGEDIIMSGTPEATKCC